MRFCCTNLAGRRSNALNAVTLGIDVDVATKMLTLANARAFDTAILVAGDKDFLETVKAVKALRSSGGDCFLKGGDVTGAEVGVFSAIGLS